jgi:hypothetical protein
LPSLVIFQVFPHVFLIPMFMLSLLGSGVSFHNFIIRGQLS